LIVRCLHPTSHMAHKRKRNMEIRPLQVAGAHAHAQAICKHRSKPADDDGDG